MPQAALFASSSTFLLPCTLLWPEIHTSCHWNHFELGIALAMFMLSAVVRKILTDQIHRACACPSIDLDEIFPSWLIFFFIKLGQFSGASFRLFRFFQPFQLLFHKPMLVTATHILPVHSKFFLPRGQCLGPADASQVQYVSSVLQMQGKTSVIMMCMTRLSCGQLNCCKFLCFRFCQRLSTTIIVLRTYIAESADLAHSFHCFGLYH